jgi:hypothetical protein
MPSADAKFVANMEEVLTLYEHPYNAEEPVVCFDETNKQLIAEVQPPRPAAPRQVAKQDFQYERNGTRNLFILCHRKFKKRGNWLGLLAGENRGKLMG